MTRPRKYVTLEEFEKFRNNDFYHLVEKVVLNTRLLYILIAALVAAVIFDRLF